MQSGREDHTHQRTEKFRLGRKSTFKGASGKKPWESGNPGRGRRGKSEYRAFVSGNRNYLLSYVRKGKKRKSDAVSESPGVHGFPGFSEYEIWQTSEEKVRNARNVINSLF